MMIKNNRAYLGTLLLATCLLTGAPLQAEEDIAPPPAPADDYPPPVIPTDDRDSIEPEVTIIRQEGRTIEEYRVNGQLYMVKVTPSRGPSYFLVDADGDGNLETRQNELDPKILVPSWIIFRW